MAESDPHDLAAARKPGTEWTHDDFEALAMAVGGRIYDFLSKRLGPFDAEDALQEVFRDAWKGRGSFDPGKLGPGGIKGWFGMIARSVCARALASRHPRLVKIRTGKCWNVVLNQPFQIPLVVSPATAVFSVQNPPGWVTVTSKPKSKPNAPQFLSGSAPALGPFAVSVVARLDGAEAMQELLINVTEDGPAEATPNQVANTVKPGDEGVARVAFESIEDHLDFRPDDPYPTLGANLDLEWLLACLSEREKDVIIRSFWDGETDEEIEAALGLNKGHAKRIRWIAITKLKGRGDDDASP